MQPSLKNYLNLLLRLTAIFLIRAYQIVLSPWFGGTCRFEPSCSEYAAIAYKQHSFVFATQLVFQRLIKCRPGGPFGPDPVPNCGCKHGQ